MVFIFTALYAEAEEIIKNYALKKLRNMTKFTLYGNEDICLCVTGSGVMRASVGVSAVLAKFSSPEDKVINIGCAGGNKEGVYLCNKIKDNIFKRTYYPDMPPKHSFKESELITEKNVWKGDKEDPCLHDMEASAVYEAASFFVSPEKIMFLKIVSDSNGENVTKEDIRLLFKNNFPLVQDAISLFLKKEEENFNFTDTSKIEEALKCTVTMKERLKRIARYLDIKGSSIYDYLPKELECKSKKEGMKILESLEEKI